MAASNGSTTSPTSPPRWRRPRAWGLRAAPAGGQDALAAVLGEAGWQDLAGIDAPVTLVRGDRGYVTEADTAQFRERMPEASVVTVSSGHNVQEEQPADLGRRLAELAGKG